MKFNNVEITQDSFNRAKHYYINLANNLIKDVESGELTVNDSERYINWKKETIEELKDMKETGNFTILQMAYFIQTGEMVALLK